MGRTHLQRSRQISMAPSPAQRQWHCHSEYFNHAHRVSEDQLAPLLARRAAGGHHYGIAFRNLEVFVYSSAAEAGLPRGLRAFRNFGEHDVLGVSFRTAAARGSTSLSPENLPEDQLSR